MQRSSPHVRIQVDDPRRADVAELLHRHLGFARVHSPPEHVHALDLEGLLHPRVTFFSARTPEGQLLGIGALKELDARHGEVKSMHTLEATRRSGVGSAMLDCMIDAARSRGYARLSLETGTPPEFDPARALYARAGFTVCAPFDKYTRNPYSVCMSLPLD